MNTFEFDMGAHILRSTKQKLSIHQQEGTKSNLSIFETAQLMDVIRNTKRSSADESDVIVLSLN